MGKAACDILSYNACIFKYLEPRNWYKILRKSSLRNALNLFCLSSKVKRSMGGNKWLLGALHNSSACSLNLTGTALFSRVSTGASSASHTTSTLSNHAALSTARAGTKGHPDRQTGRYGAPMHAPAPFREEPPKLALHSTSSVCLWHQSKPICTPCDMLPTR